MSLILYIDEIPKDCTLPVENDVEKLFDSIEIEDSPVNRLFLREIEQADYSSGVDFIDRFGNKLDKECLSTGCKAAICVANIPNIIVNGLGCGLNARDSIIRNCKQGNFLIRDSGITVSYNKENTLDVILDNYRFTSITALNKYIFDVRPFEMYGEEGYEELSEGSFDV